MRKARAVNCEVSQETRLGARFTEDQVAHALRGLGGMTPQYFESVVAPIINTVTTLVNKGKEEGVPMFPEAKKLIKKPKCLEDIMVDI